MAPFRAKIGGKRIREGENKNSFHSVPIRRGIEIAKRKAKKLKKLKKYHYGIISSQNCLEKDKKDRK